MTTIKNWFTFFPLFTCLKNNNPPNHTFLISKRTRENITKNGQFGLFILLGWHLLSQQRELINVDFLTRLFWMKLHYLNDTFRKSGKKWSPLASCVSIPVSPLAEAPVHRPLYWKLQTSSPQSHPTTSLLGME